MQGTENKLLLTTPQLICEEVSKHHLVQRPQRYIALNSGVHHATFSFQVTQYKAVPLILSNSRVVEPLAQNDNILLLHGGAFISYLFIHFDRQARSIASR